jgi:hypothetical protein
VRVNLEHRERERELEPMIGVSFVILVERRNHRFIHTGHVDKELRSTGLGLTGIGHTECPGRVADAGCVFVGDTTVLRARERLTGRRRSKASIGIRTTGTGATAIGVFGVRATELAHKVGYDPVEINAVVKAAVGQIDKVTRRNGRLLRKQLHLEGAHGRFANGKFRHHGCFINNNGGGSEDQTMPEDEASSAQQHEKIRVGSHGVMWVSVSWPAGMAGARDWSIHNSTQKQKPNKKARSN